MRQLHTSLRFPLRTTGVVACLLLFLAPTAFAQTGQEGVDATVVLEGGRAKVRLAFPSVQFANLSGSSLEAARELEDTLRYDLEESGIFNIQGPEELSVLTLTGDRTLDFDQYRSLGNEVVLLASVELEGDRLVLKGRLFDLPSYQSISGKLYRGLLDQARRIAHWYADELHRQFTGRPGIALTTLAFHSRRDGYQELYLMDYDGRDQRRITAHHSTSGFPSWSPDGNAIAYVSYFSSDPGVYYVALPGGAKTPIYTQGTVNLSPSYSPDGRNIVFSHSDASNIDIYTCALPCSSPRRLTNSPGIDTNAQWGPSGQLAFTSDRSGSPNIYVMNEDGSNVRRISFEGRYNDGATWRPDGAQLAYASRRSGSNFQIAVTDLVDLTSRVLTSGPDSHEEPTFSPDGRRIAFSLKRGPSSQIYMMHTDGSQLRQLTHEGNNFSPAWSGYPNR